MVYTANWVIIYHLPPIKGTRNSYWFFYWKKSARPFTSVPLWEEVRNCAASQMWIPWVVFLNSHRPLDYDGFKNKNTSPQKKKTTWFFWNLCFVCFVSTAFQDLGVIFFQPNKKPEPSQFFRCIFFSAPFETICQNRAWPTPFGGVFLCSCFRRPLSPPKAKESTRKVRFRPKKHHPDFMACYNLIVTL